MNLRGWKILSVHHLAVIFIITLLNDWINAQAFTECENNRPTSGPPSAPWSQPSDCATNKYKFLTVPLAKVGAKGGVPVYAQGKASHRTNSIQDFCVLTDIYTPKSPATGPPFPPGYPERPKYDDVPAAQECYKVPPPAPRTAGTFHSAGNDPHWTILDHLVRHKAQSFQPYDDLPYVQPDLGKDRFLELAHDAKVEPPFPKSLSPNPYYVEVTGISVKGELLHNFLHFRIFANLSVAIGKDQFERHKVLHHKTERANHATGKISALLIMVKDQDGWPVGDFSQPVPCMRTCTKYSHDVYYGDESNAVPCSYTPPFASMHPGMFVYDADPGRYCTKEMGINQTHKVDEKIPIRSSDPRTSAHTSRNEGAREVHATWSFGHSTCNFVQRLYIQTLVFEDVESVYPGFFGNKPSGKTTEPNLFLFGWTAQYNILQTTRSTLGAPDYVDLKYLRDRVKRSDDVDCHVPLFDAEKTVKSNFRKFYVPKHDLLFDPILGPVQDEIKVPSRSGYTAALWAYFKKDPNLQYFGQHAPPYASTTHSCRELPKAFLVSDEVKKVFGDKKPDNLATFLSKRGSGIRCPCPALASTLAPEDRTADPARLHGRLIHASHMCIAYMFLTPIGCFVARYYKETFVTIFCFQEYWWFMWHVVTLIAACLFNIGALTSIARKKTVDLKYNDNLIIHILFGVASIFVFYMEIITGFFRVANPKKRMRQIFTHWLIGVTNNFCAVFSMFAMAWVDQSGFSCKVAYTLVFWLLFVIFCYVVMEVDMRKTDKKLRLIPRRSYLPPPVKRLFTKEPPGRQFRLTMLVIFIVGLIIIQGMVSYYIWNADGGASCEEEYRESARRRNKLVNTEDVESVPETGGGGNSGGGGGEYSY